MKSAKEVVGEYYVYIWFERKDGNILPFYVGMSKTETRWKNRSGRSDTFKEYIKNKDVFSMKVITDVCYECAALCEEKLQKEIKKRGFTTIDAEYDSEERKKRQREGIDAMPIVDGKRVSTKTGRPTGRPKRDIDIQKYAKMVRDGKITVVAACKELSISRQTWYRLVG